jgi:hypothetical protein
MAGPSYAYWRMSEAEQDLHENLHSIRNTVTVIGCMIGLAVSLIGIRLTDRRYIRGPEQRKP